MTGAGHERWILDRASSGTDGVGRGANRRAPAARDLGGCPSGPLESVRGVPGTEFFHRGQRREAVAGLERVRDWHGSCCCLGPKTRAGLNLHNLRMYATWEVGECQRRS